MGIEALTHDREGTRAVPETSEDWDEWVSASATRNHILDDPLVDWLGRHGEAKGYLRDGPETVDERTDFLSFIFSRIGCVSFIP